MKIENIVCIILCIIMLFSITACKKNTGDAAESSAVSTSDVQSVTSENVSDTSSESNPSSTTSSDNANSSQNDVSSNNSSENSTSSSDSSGNSVVDDFLDNLYGFKSIKSVDYYCVKNTPDSDPIYAVSKIITDIDTNICDYSTTISCTEKSIIINGKTITVPRSYAKTHDSVMLTARHDGSGISRTFELKFEDDWNLLFEDNFDGTKLNTEVWNVWDEERDWRYSYSKDNMFLDGKGNLVNRMAILEKPDAATGESKTSGAMTTQGTFETTYGYFEIRMIAHRSPGLMGAFWLMCGDMGDKDAANDSTAKNGCEVDIIETFYHNMNPAHTIHWDGYTHTKSQGFPNQGREDIFDGNYHTYAFRWSPTEYAFLIDGVVTARCNTVDICTEPGYLLISSHFNSQAGEPTFGVGEHTDMIVDYVKVYQSPSDPV